MEAWSVAPQGHDGSEGQPLMGCSEWDGGPRFTLLSAQFASPLQLANYLESRRRVRWRAAGRAGDSWVSVAGGAPVIVEAVVLMEIQEEEIGAWCCG
eukprot:1842133-Amphidinium_carterae.1